MKNLNLLFCLLLLTMGYTILPAQSPVSLFQKAGEAYQNQQFDQAVELYKQILSQGYENKAVYYNLGNSYFRLNEIGQAVLYYEKALKIDPNDADVKYNLELAGLRVVDRVEIPPRFFLFDWWDSVRNYFSLTQLTYLVMLFFMFTMGSLVIWLFIKTYRLRRWLVTFSTVAGLLTIFAGYILFLNARTAMNHRSAVILVPSVTVVSAPDEKSTDVFILHEGIKVTLDEQRQEWVKISLPDGKSGWIKSGTMGMI
jgi:tetratricopeptide (TPR) repeat protein